MFVVLEKAHDKGLRKEVWLAGRGWKGTGGMFASGLSHDHH